MKERPIIFNGDMVRAIIDERKTMTRRPVKGRDLEIIEFLSGRCDDEQSITSDLGQWWKDEKLFVWCAEYPEEGVEAIDCPYGKIKESFVIVKKHDDREFEKVGVGEITNIRVERLHDITPEECKKEGVLPKIVSSTGEVIEKPDYGLLIAFGELWDSIYAKRGCGWESNPWVWVIEFKVVEIKK